MQANTIRTVFSSAVTYLLCGVLIKLVCSQEKELDKGGIISCIVIIAVAFYGSCGFSKRCQGNFMCTRVIFVSFVVLPSYKVMILCVLTNVPVGIENV